MKGLRANIYKHGGASYANGGISGDADAVTIIGIVQAGKRLVDESIEPVFEGARVFEPSADAPAVVIVHRLGMPTYAAPARFTDKVIRFEGPQDAVGPMAGGCYIGGSDARFRDLTGTFDPISLHDRFETAAQYASYD